MRLYPKDMQQFISIALRSTSAADAYTSSKTIKGVSVSTTKWFSDTFGRGVDGRVSMFSFEQFFDEIKSGQYIVEGEMEKFNDVIVEIKDGLLKESIEDLNPDTIENDYE